MAGGWRPTSRGLAALVWLEQVQARRFRAAHARDGQPRYATLDLADFDLDGDLDIVVGNFLIAGKAAGVGRSLGEPADEADGNSLTMYVNHGDTENTEDAQRLLQI